MYLRFANLVQEANNKAISLWKNVKYIRNEFLRIRKEENACLYQNTFVTFSEIGENTRLFSQLLNIEKDHKEALNSNISSGILNLSGELFIYMNQCPNKQNQWIMFYKDLMGNNSLSQIILTLNRLKKSKVGHQETNHFHFASAIFDLITNKFSLKYPFNQNPNLENLDQQTNQSLYGKLSNHPVHILDKQSGNISPSAFIPFCEFGENMSSVGTQIKEFNLLSALHLSQRFYMISFATRLISKSTKIHMMF